MRLVLMRHENVALDGISHLYVLLIRRGHCRGLLEVEQVSYAAMDEELLTT